jgi:hypothetical protein
MRFLPYPVQFIISQPSYHCAQFELLAAFLNKTQIKIFNLPSRLGIGVKEGGTARKTGFTISEVEMGFTFCN